MHPNERALIERLTTAQSVTLDNKFIPTWTIDQSDPLNAGCECQIIRLQWIDDDGQACSTSIDRGSVQKGGFLPGSVFVCTDTEDTGIHLRFTPKTTSHPTVDDFLDKQPLYAHQAFSPELLEIDLTSILGQRLAFILDPVRIYACSEDEWPRLALQAIQSAHAVLLKADPSEKNTPYETASSPHNAITHPLMDEFKRLLMEFEGAAQLYGAACCGASAPDNAYDEVDAARNHLLALFASATSRHAFVG